MSRYHIRTQPAPAPFQYPAKFQMDETDAYVKYGHRVFQGTSQRGDRYWTAEILSQTWYEAETGRVPISGAGYGGPFSGEGFEGMWLDMSEIVRPTRDGIHGREYISTAVSLGGAPEMLEFDDSNRLLTPLPRTMSLPLPVVFGPLPIPLPGRGALRALSLAAERLGTLCILTPDTLDVASNHNLALRLSAADFDSLPTLPREPVYVEFEDEPWAFERWRVACERWRGAMIGLRHALGPDSPAEIERLVRRGVRLFHLYADDEGRDLAGRPLPDSLRAVHSHLVQRRWRDSLSFLVSGGIAAAEHVPKVIACGADAVVLDWIPIVAWGCGLWADKQTCPVEKRETDAEWGAQRLINLMAAWRDQLLEALGAMGMREVRRLRGEVGRVIFEEIEAKAFRRLFPTTAPFQSSRRLPEEESGEGDMRWTHALLASTHQQARDGSPDGKQEFRVGGSGGGFDRLTFAFELTDKWQRSRRDDWLADPAGFDMSLPLNGRRDGRPELHIPLPWYGAGMSFGSVGLPVMLSRARAAQSLGTFTSTGEGGYPDALIPYADFVITQIATGLFGVREETIQRARLVEIKYAQGAKPGLGGHLLGNKNTECVAQEREAVCGTSLFSPFPFHSVYSVEDHKKHVDWLKQINPRALISVKVSTPTDVDMVAVGSYFAGAHIVHLDGAYGGTGAAPEIAKKNIAMPIEYAVPKVHCFLESEGIRDELTIMASGGIRTAYDVAKAIALGADGCVIGTAELVAMGCTRLGSCEQGFGCPFGITTTDPERSKLVDVENAWRLIVNLYTSWLWQLAGILRELGMKGIHELRGRTDVLVYLE
ncbi:MAG: glutamate synthase-related protein [Candidatus Eisenbacteria bacterium]|nr:glutamate synthase-related protein [Candidatus Eisenbacteria bacterium]